MRASILALLVCFAAGPVAAADLAPHRALYRLSLQHSTANSAVTNAAGDMVYEIDDLCSGWATLTEVRIQLLYDSGEEARFGTSAKAWESKDGLAYRFFIKERSTFSPSYDLEGEAQLDAVGQGGRVAYAGQADGSFPLPVGTAFPLQHAIAVTRAAAAGEQLIYGRLFDGGEDAGLYDVSAAIGPPRPAGSDSVAALPDAAPLLEGQLSWPVRLAYFELEDESGAALQEVSLHLYANGVVTDQRFDFSDFTLRADLVSLEPLPKPDC